MRPPLWLLDVDGVLNCTRPGWSSSPRTASVYSKRDQIQYKMRWSPQAMTRIGALHLGGDVEIQWCTTWSGETDELERLFGLPHFGDARVPRGRPPGPPLDKAAAALAVIGAGRRLIWSDDDCIPVDGPIRAKLDAVGALLLVPDSRRGLRPADLDRIIGYSADSVSVE